MKSAQKFTQLHRILYWIMAISMAIGMLPITLGSGTAAEWKNGLAWVIIGGLLSSLALTVYLVPMIYDLVDDIKGKMGRRGKR